MEAHDAVEVAMDEARQELGIKWSEVARRVGVVPQTLWRYRKGEQRTADTTRKIEVAFGWPRGYIEALAEGREPPEHEHTHPDYSQMAQQLDELIPKLLDMQRQLDALRRRGAG